MIAEPAKPTSVLKLCLYAGVACFSALLLAAGFLLATGTSSGSATLPNGARIDITARGGMSVADNQANETTISVGGRSLVFTESGLTVDGAPVKQFDARAPSYKLTYDWSGLRLSCGDKTLRLP
ncbi:MAG: hypothetical protein AAF790_02685 [Planctomycetota bacterium]